ncbi:hypothetical protein I7I51_01600 [Histoplasma capsulatum]|uniref:Cytochrome b5 heme-binding domain-containing protein n=1 Tax=Ajellomyces capsulatus TaxID=5037 RepID=A0A8A1MIY6_AJECA|nr:hypothetical protein I7I51_01600 [Histoplasma capsulatum]
MGTFSWASTSASLKQSLNAVNDVMGAMRATLGQARRVFGVALSPNDLRFRIQRTLLNIAASPTTTTARQSEGLVGTWTRHVTQDGSIENMSGGFSADAVSAHNTPDNLWIIIDEDVYDLTKFQDEHPGGKKTSRWEECLKTVLEISQCWCFETVRSST